jgi:hypothetical protein
MSDQNNDTVDLSLMTQDLRTTYDGWGIRAQKASLASSAIKAVGTEAEDKTAEQMIVKLRNTINGWKKDDGTAIEGIKAARLEKTRQIDELKKLLMGPEKVIEAEMTRIQALRNSFANEALKKAQETARKVEAEKKVADEKAAIKAKIRNSITNGTIDKINAMNSNIKAHMADISLDNWDEKVKKFDASPKLKQEIYDAFFNVSYDTVLLKPEDYQAVVSEMKQEVPYEKANADYVFHAKGTLKLWVDDLPNIKEKLYNIKKLVGMGANGGAEAQASNLLSVADTAGSALLDTAQSLRKENEEKEATDQLQNEINSQVGLQAITTPSGRMKKVAKIVAEPKNLATVWSKAIFAIYLAKGPNAHFKKDGVTLADWAEQLLNILANDTDAKIDGIVYEDVVSTIAKKG